MKCTLNVNCVGEKYFSELVGSKLPIPIRIQPKTCSSSVLYSLLSQKALNPSVEVKTEKRSFVDKATGKTIEYDDFYFVEEIGKFPVHFKVFDYTSKRILLDGLSK